MVGKLAVPGRAESPAPRPGPTTFPRYPMSGRFTSIPVAIALALSLTAAIAARAGAPDTPPDLSGAWKLDPSKSDQPQRPEGGGPGGGGMRGGMGGGGGGRHGGGGGGGGGGWGGGGRGGGGGGGGFGRHGGGGGAGEGAPPPDAAAGGDPAGAPGGGHGGPRPGWLPGFLRIAQTSKEIEFADSAGAEVREIALVAAPFDSNAAAPKVPRDPGEWNKSKLEVEKTGPGDLKIKEEFALEDGGQTLVIKTHMDGGRGGSRDLKRTYRRVSAS